MTTGTGVAFHYRGATYRQKTDHLGRAIYRNYPDIWHLHAVYHLILVCEGRHYLDLEKETLLLRKNTLLLLNPMVRHRFRHMGTETFEHAAILWRMVNVSGHSCRVPLPVFAGLAGAAPPLQMVGLTPPDAARFRNQVQDLSVMFRSDPETGGWELPLFHLWYSALGYFRREAPLSGEDFWCGAIDQEISIHIHEPDFSVKRLAVLLGRHPNYLSGVYRRRRGYSISDALVHCRMEHAACLLTDTDSPIGEIAEQCGYRQCGWFARKFRECFEVTPLQYRRLNSRTYNTINHRTDADQ